MSTRALIAVKKANGGYTTAWNWSDGGEELFEKLNEYFMDRTSIEEILEMHSFACIMTEEEKADYDKINEANGISEAVLKDDKWTKLSNGLLVLSRPHHGKVVDGREPDGHFDSIEDMLGCDVNYVYVFDRSGNGRWSRHSYI